MKVYAVVHVWSSEDSLQESALLSTMLVISLFTMWVLGLERKY